MDKPFLVSKKLKTMMLLTLIAIVLIVTYIGIVQPRQRAYAISHLSINGVIFPNAVEMKHFQLTDHNGAIFTNDNLKGQWTFVFFGFTNCGSICPTTMAALVGMYKTLKNELPHHKLPKIVFVSIDPARDTVSRLREFINAYHPHFIGTKGEPQETHTLMNQMHILSVKMQAGSDKNRYMLDHTADIFIFNPEGKLQAKLFYPHDAERLAKDFKAILMIDD